MHSSLLLIPALAAIFTSTVRHVADAALSMGGHERSRPASAMQRRVVASDSVDFVKLRAQSTQRDCENNTTSLCRIRRPVNAASLAEALERKQHVIRGTNELTFLARGNGKSMEVTGGLQYPMSRVVGTDMWVVTLHVPDVERAVVSYSFISSDLQVGQRIQTMTWRGPQAPAAALKSATVQGILRVDTLRSANLSIPRAVFSYTPPSRGDAPIAGVVYLGDGSGVPALAKYVDTLIATGKLPRVMLVGVPSGEASPSDPPGTDVRAMEYLMDFEDGNARFLAHEKFMFDEVIPWAEKTLGAPRTREQRAVWGISNSGGWAIDMGLRHPDVVGVVLGFSPGGAHGRMPPGAAFAPAVRFLLQAGTLEPAFHRIASHWNDSLRSKGITPTFREVIAGHDWEVWCEQFPAALQWAWMRNERMNTHE